MIEQQREEAIGSKSQQLLCQPQKFINQIQQRQEGEYKYLKKAEIDKDNKFDLRFQEIRGSLITKNFFEAGKIFLSYRLKNGKKNINQPHSKQDYEKLQKQLPMVKPIIKINYEDHSIKYTWIGHSTALIQVGADHLMIDPVFSERCSPLSFMGPKRYRPPACSIEELKKVNLVLVSHDHYDHLDSDALESLNKIYKPIFVAGLRSQDAFPKKSHLIEMDWMQTEKVLVDGKYYKITFVPVCHWSRRGPCDSGQRLWGGFVIETPYNQKIFYSGDTGYAGVFKQIGHKYGPFDLAILPIGAYEPRELLSAQHVNPEESVKIHLDLRSKKSVGVHWGTFPLGQQHFYQAKYDLRDARQKYNLKENQFVALKHGQTLSIL